MRKLLFVLILLVCRAAPAHDVPIQLPPPQSAGEAWNVVEQSKGNISQLIDANLMRDVGGQLANVAAALRWLKDHGDGDERQLAGELLSGEIDLLTASRDAGDARRKIKAAWEPWCEKLKRLESLYPAETVHAEVYICRMHPLDRHLASSDKCSICGMSLVRRKLPASAVYQKPGEPTLKLSLQSPRLTVGRPATVLIRLARADGSPIKPDDLIETHTKKIHLLINDRSLSDYHHEHPEPTGRPGEYRFIFTPQKPGPYRIWADVVPEGTGVQEYDVADLPADTAPEPVTDRETKLANTAAGLRFKLAFETPQPIRANQTVIGTIEVSDKGDKPFSRLEPVMGSFAHLVGFSEDGKTVLHIHPFGKEPTSAADRAGPGFAFKFYSPAPGFLRLYCQVRANGQDVFVPFNLTIAPDKKS